MRARRFKVGEWVVRPDLNRIEGPAGTATLEPKAMDLLVALAERGRDVVTQDELRERLWADTCVSENALFRLVSELRAHLDDNPRAPRFIQTIPKRGYRLVADVVDVETPGRRWRTIPAVVVAGVAVAAAVWLETRTPSRVPPSAEPARPESYAVGEVFEDRVDCSSYERARSAFEEALRTDPEYRPTYGHLTDSYLASAVLGCIPSEPARARIDDLVGLRGQWDSESQRLRHQAAARFWLHWDVSAAGDLFRQVPELPDVSRAAYLLTLGRPGEALSEAERAWRADPAQLGETWSLATARLLVGDYNEAAERYRQLLSVYPDYPPAVSLSALAALLGGRPDEALSIAERAAGFERAPADRFAPIPALVLMKLGRPRAARALLDRWDRSARDAAWVAPTALATASLARGQREEAVRALEEGRRRRDPWLIVVGLDPTFAELRDDGRFEALRGP